LSAWLKEQANDLPPLEETLQSVECKKNPVLEVDELWSFVFRSKDKVWVWIAMNRETREIVASACGDRTENTCRVLWDRVPSAYKETIVFSDYWSAYQAVIPSEQQRLVGKETGEAAQRQQLARFLRKTLSFSKCVKLGLVQPITTVTVPSLFVPELELLALTHQGDMLVQSSETAQCRR